MKILVNTQGVALVTALLLTLISLTITMGLLTFIIAGTKISASHKRYSNSLAAAYGGVEVAAKDLIPKIFGNMTSSVLTSTFSNIHLSLQSSNACIRQKLNLPTSQWDIVNTCLPGATSRNAAIAPDFTFTLSGQTSATNFNLSAKIVDTVPGNSDPSGTTMLDPGMAVAGTTPGISPMHLPAMLTIEVEGTQGNNPQEKADLSALYAY